MRIEKAFYTGTNIHSFRQGEQAEILNIKMVTPDDLTPRACFHIRYEDGVEDYVLIRDQENYNIQKDKK